jgi:hypothetical protein
MKILKYIGIGIAAIIGIFLIIALFVPKDFTYERSIVINAPKDIIMPQVTSLKKSNAWSPWMEKDPNLKISYEGADGEVGSKSSWKGNDEVGEGNQEITSITPNRVETKLNFVKPFESTSMSYTQLDEQGAAATKVTWGFKGSNPYPFNAICLFMDMDAMIGKDFEKGLSRLKAVCEKK